MLSKCSRIKSTGELQFHLNIDPLPPRFDPDAIDKFATVHHLIASAWNFRWRILNRYKTEVAKLHELKGRPNREEDGFSKRMNRLINEFRADMLAVEIDGEIRGLTDLERLMDAFKEPPPSGQAVANPKQSDDDIATLKPLMGTKWPDLRIQLEDAMQKREDGLALAITLLQKGSEMNQVCYELAARRYWELSKSLQ
jgi:hypothetical protein